jgi:hypothetical protein
MPCDVIRDRWQRQWRGADHLVPGAGAASAFAERAVAEHRPLRRVELIDRIAMPSGVLTLSKLTSFDLIFPKFSTTSESRSGNSGSASDGTDTE